MSKISRDEFLQRSFEESIKELNKEYPFFIPCHVLRKALERKIASIIKKVLSDLVKSLFEKSISTFNEEGIVLEPINYSLVFPDGLVFPYDAINLGLDDEAWEDVISIANQYGFTQQNWHDIPIFTCNLENEDLCPFSNKYRKILTDILSMHGHIEFYGGELFTREEEEGDDFFYNTFSIQSLQLESIKIDSYRHEFSFSIAQLKFFAESIGKTIVRQVLGDALVTIECLDIC